MITTSQLFYCLRWSLQIFLTFSLHSTHSFELIFESSLDLCGWNTALSSSRCLAGENNKSDILLPEMVVTDFLKIFFAFHSLVQVNFWVLPWFVWLKYSTIIQPVLSRWKQQVSYFIASDDRCRFFNIFLRSTHSFELIFEVLPWFMWLKYSTFIHCRCLAGDNNKSVILLPEMVVTDFFKFSLHSTHSYELIFESSLDLCGWNTALSSSRCLAGENNKSDILLPEMVVTDFIIFFCIPLTRSS